MTIIKWQTGSYDTKIEPIECTRETAQIVWRLVGGLKREERKQAKSSEWHQLHDSWDAAHAFLMERAEAKLANARTQLASAQGAYGNVKGMKKPEQS